MTFRGMTIAKPYETKNRFQVGIEFEANSTIACTLLMPQKNMREYRRQLRKFDGSVRKYFQYLVKRYINRINSSKLQKSARLTARYQEAGQNLKKIHLRVKPSDWNQIGLVARTCGYSICHLFVFLMEREFAKKGGTTGAGIRADRGVKLKKVEFREIRLDGTNRCTRTLTLNSGNSPP